MHPEFNSVSLWFVRIYSDNCYWAQSTIIAIPAKAV